MDVKDLEVYEKPAVEVLEFTIEDSIALSGEGASNVICTDVWSDM